jgi:endoribonuclease Nob1
LHSSLVVDAAAFYAGTTFLTSDQRLYTTLLVFDEVKHIKSRLSALEALTDSGRIVIQDPARPTIDLVVQAASRTGDIGTLSAADVSIIALALELGMPLVTDDYSAANVASFLRVTVKSATSGKEIKEIRRWIQYCSACSRTFAAEAKECPLCGNKLKRKYKKVRNDK